LVAVRGLLAVRCHSLTHTRRAAAIVFVGAGAGILALGQLDSSWIRFAAFATMLLFALYSKLSGHHISCCVITFQLVFAAVVCVGFFLFATNSCRFTEVGEIVLPDCSSRDTLQPSVIDSCIGLAPPCGGDGDCDIAELKPVVDACRHHVDRLGLKFYRPRRIEPHSVPAGLSPATAPRTPSASAPAT